MEILQMLVIDGYNTNVNLPDNGDLTPLHYVCFNGRNTLRRRPEMAKFLLSYGANINIKSTRGFSLLEYELKSLSEDFELLRYVVRSMLHPPHLAKLRVIPHMPLPLRDHYLESQPGEMMGYVMAAVLHARAGMAQYTPPPVRAIDPARAMDPARTMDLNHKHLWYEAIASNPRTLQHYCRYTIRKALGPHNIKNIPKLPIPNSMQSYLLLHCGE